LIKNRGGRRKADDARPGRAFRIILEIGRQRGKFDVMDAAGAGRMTGTKRNFGGFTDSSFPG
jgi:hypothetical protein